MGCRNVEDKTVNFITQTSEPKPPFWKAGHSFYSHSSKVLFEHSTTCEQEWICSVSVVRGKHVIFNSNNEKFWEKREIVNDYHVSFLPKPFDSEGLAHG